MIKKFRELVNKVISPQQDIVVNMDGGVGGSWRVELEKDEHAIDEEVVDCGEMDSPSYIGVPAPAYLDDDSWFGPAPLPTENQTDYMERETKIKREEQESKLEKTCESEDIHAKMYEIATQNWTTVEEIQGGSENFQEGPSGWKSGIR